MRLHTPSVSADTSVDQNVLREVQLQTNGLVHGLQVSVIAGHVVLTGRASSYYAKQLASHAAMNVLDDVLELTNNIEVG